MSSQHTHYRNLHCFCFFLAPTPIPSKWAEYILFAALLLVVCIVFAIMARFYTYVNPAEVEARFDNEDEKKNLENMNIYATVAPVSQTQM